MSFQILIADDEPIIRMDLREMLEEIGHQVVAEARDGQEALRLIQEKNPEVVILDIKMPGMDGISVAREMAKQYPIIILTAYSERNLVEQARDAGIMQYLWKPFRIEDLAPAIELAVSHFLEKAELSERVSKLQEQLEARKWIEKAKGLLMKAENLNETQAYRKLQKISMEKNIPMKKVAEAIITAHG
jgi:response regulator NasT